MPHSAAPVTRPVVQPRVTRQQEQNLVIERYRKERACHGAAYTAARRYAAQWLDSVVSVPTEPLRVADAMENARFRIRLAQTATTKRCFDVARDTYAEVNGIFTGNPYSDLRQRADFGLNTLPQSPNPRAVTPAEVQH